MEKPDDLEITSIGALYRGQWDKKYWSSSRGKERYPYPVGYQAVRTHTGITYRMEIHEGPKGPVFEVISAAGESCSGQTPGIAWENFQKKCSPRVKNWHGKRFSSKIDGVELFGFRNPFVQRLLRELVSNVDGVAEKSSVASSSSKKSKLDHGRKEKSLDCPDLLSSLGKRQITGRQSLKKKCSPRNFIKEASAKRARSEVLLNNAGCNSKHEYENLSLARERRDTCVQEEHISSLGDGVKDQISSDPCRNSPGGGTTIVCKETPDSECQKDGIAVGCAASGQNSHRYEDPSAPLDIEAATTVDENCNSFLAGEEILMKSKKSECFVDKHITCSEQNSHMSHENPILNTVRQMKSFDAELEQRESLTSSNKSCENFVDLPMNLDVCIPDSCEDTFGCSPLQSNKPVVTRPVGGPVLETSTISACEIPSRGMPYELNNTNDHDISKPLLSLPAEVLVADNFLSKELVKDSFADFSSSSGSSNPSSEKIDLELAGQELAKSMMTFLLPRAVPLLTKTYVKRRSWNRSRENKKKIRSDLLLPNAKHIKSNHLTNHTSEGPEVSMEEKPSARQIFSGSNTLCQATRVEPSGRSKDAKSVVADSFEDDQYTHGVSTARKSPPNFDESNIAIKGYFSPSIFPGSNSERACPSSGNDKCSEDSLLPYANLSCGNLFSDSVLDLIDPDKCIPLEQEFTNDYPSWKPNYSGRECNDIKYSVDPQAKSNSSQPLVSECAHSMGVISHQYIPIHNLLKTDEDEPSEHLVDDTLKTNMVQSHSVCHTDKGQTLGPNGQIKSDVHGVTESRDHQLGTQITQAGHDKKADSMLEGESSLICMPNILSSNDLQLNDDTARSVLSSPHGSKYCAPLSEIIVCRNYKDSTSPEFHFPQKVSDSNENNRARHMCIDKDIRIQVTNEVKLDDQLKQSITEEDVPDTLFITAMDASENKVQDVTTTVTNYIKSSHFVSPSNPSSMKNNANSLSSAFSRPGENYSVDTFSKWENSTMDRVDSMELIGSYVHPDPVLSIFLASKDESLQIFVLCGLVENDVRNLFVYMVPDKEHRGNCPSFIGYTSLVLSLLEGPCNSDANISFKRCGLQFAPDGQSIVFLNSVKAPRCREQNFDCSCMDCKSNCSEENTIEIVHVNFGYVSSVIKFVMVERVSCILACEPNYLVAVEQSGNFNVWMMNTRWSVVLEEFRLPKFDDASPAMLELKRIPNCNCLVIGHNGLGGFALWDISKRVLLAKFASPGITTFHIVPVGLTNCQNEDTLKFFMEADHNKESLSITDDPLPKVGKDYLLSLSQDDLAIWLLVSAAFGAEAHQEDNNTTVGWWRLAVLQRGMVVMGSILDSRTSAVNTLSNFGIYGTYDGFMYKWDLSSGEKLDTLRPFTSGSISGIATDTESGTIAVAGNGCEVLVYAPILKANHDNLLNT